MNIEEPFWVTPSPYIALQPRDREGCGTEAQAASRRLKVLELYANLSSARAIIHFITDLGYSITTAKEDLAWARQQWLDLTDLPGEVFSDNWYIKATCDLLQGSC